MMSANAHKSKKFTCMCFEKSKVASAKKIKCDRLPFYFFGYSPDA